MKRFLPILLLLTLLSPVLATGVLPPIFVNKPSAVVGPPVLVFLQEQTGSNSTNTSTFTAMNIGSTSGFTTRRIIFSIAADGGTLNGGLTSVVVNGSITATLNVSSNSNGGAFIASADVPTGTTANVVVTAGGTIFNTIVISTYTVDDALLISTTPSTSSGTTAGASSVTSGSFMQTTGGIAISSLSATGTLGGSGASISGYTLDALGGSGNKEASFSKSSIASTGSTTITANWTTSQAADIVVAAWR